MKKLLASLAGSLLLTLAVTGYSNADGPIVLRYADTSVPGQGDFKGNLLFAELVKRYTGGKVEVQYFHSSQLGADKAITQSAIAGTVDIAKCSSGNFAEFSQALAFTEIPGLFRDMEHVRKIWLSDIRESVIKQIKQETGLTPLMFDVDGGNPREIGNSKRAIRVPADTKGLKFRTTGSPIELALLKAWGTSAAPVAWNELYTALQQGVVDAYYVQPVQTFYTAKFQEVAKHFTVIGQSWVTSIKALGPAAEKKLGPELYARVIQAGREAELFKDALEVSSNLSALAGLEAAGVKVVRPTPEEMKLWNEKSRAIWPELIGSGKPVSQEIIDRVLAIK